MNRFMSKRNSDHHLLFSDDPLSHLAIDASSCTTLMHIQGKILNYTLRFDAALFCKCWNAQVDESLRRYVTALLSCRYPSISESVALIIQNVAVVFTKLGPSRGIRHTDKGRANKNEIR